MIKRYECEQENWEIFKKWMEWNGNIERTAAASGVSERTIYRWVKAERVPSAIAALSDQALNGLVFRGGGFRGASFIRWDRRAKD